MPRVIGPTAGLPGAFDVELDDGSVQTFAGDVLASAGLGQLPPAAPVSNRLGGPGAGPALADNSVSLADVSPEAAADAAALDRARSGQTATDARGQAIPGIGNILPAKRDRAGGPLPALSNGGLSLADVSPAAAAESAALEGAKPPSLPGIGQVLSADPATMKRAAARVENRPLSATEARMNLEGTDFEPVEETDPFAGLDVSAGFRDKPKSTGFGSRLTRTQKLQQTLPGPISEEQAAAMAATAEDFQSASAEERDAMVKQYHVAANEAERAAQAMNDLQTTLAVEQRKEELRADAIRKRLAKHDKVVKDAAARFAASEDIDPGRVFGEKDSPGRVVAAIGMGIAAGLGQAAAALTGGENAALATINNAIDRDVAAQKANVNKLGQNLDVAKGAYADALREMGTPEEAEALARSIGYKFAAVEADRIGKEGEAAGLRAGADRMVAELERQAAEAQLAAQQAVIPRITIEEERKTVAPLRGGGGGGGGGGGRGRSEGIPPDKQEQTRNIIAFMEANPADPKTKVVNDQIAAVSTRLEAAGVLTQDAAIADLRSQVQSRIDKGELPASVGPWADRLFRAMSRAGFGSFTPDEWQSYRQQAAEISGLAVKMMSGPGAITDSERAYFGSRLGLDPEHATPTSVANALARQSRSAAVTEANILGTMLESSRLVYEARYKHGLRRIKQRQEGAGERVGRIRE